MGFAFEGLAVYQKSLDLSILVIDAIDDLETMEES
jgi:hypothetical protein